MFVFSFDFSITISLSHIQGRPYSQNRGQGSAIVSQPTDHFAEITSYQVVFIVIAIAVLMLLLLLFFVNVVVVVVVNL